MHTYWIGNRVDTSKLTRIGGRAEFIAYEHPDFGEDAAAMICTGSGLIVAFEQSDCFDDYEDEDLDELRSVVAGYAP